MATRHSGQLSRQLGATALFALGALIVHQGRYLLGYGDGWREVLGKSGHEYFGLLIPIVVALALVSAVLFVAELRGASRGAGRPRQAPRPPSFLRSWLAGYAVLCTVYVAQESSEGFFSGEHSAGLSHLLASGGWIAFVLALGVAALVALVLRGAAVALSRAFDAEQLPAAPRPLWLPGDLVLPPTRPVGRNLAPRGPPPGLL